MQPDTFRWLLTALSAPAFVRLYVEPCEGGQEAERWPLRLYEAAFFSLTDQRSHPPQGQKEAWLQIREAAESLLLTPAEFFALVLRIVWVTWQSRRTAVSDYFDIASSSGILALLPAPARGELVFPYEGRSVSELCSDNYVEIHAHLEGCVPFDWLWEKWMTWDTSRPCVDIVFPIEQSTSSQLIAMDRRQTTYGKLLQTAANLRLRLRNERPSLASREDCFRMSLRDSILHSRKPPDHAVAYLAIYIGIRRSMIFDRSISGLVRFTNFFGKTGDLRPGQVLLQQQVQETMRRFCQDGAIGVELRTIFGRSRRQFQKTLNALIAGYFDYLNSLDFLPVVVPRFGIVLSLDKNPDLTQSDQLSDEKFWDKQACTWESQAKMLLELLDEYPLYRYFVVAIDAAGQEQGCPPRALSRPVQLIHKYNKERRVKKHAPGRLISDQQIRAMHDAYRANGSGIGALHDHLNEMDPLPIRLGITIHAGEDFVDPMTGLRHIWETIECLGLRNGDRIGHALAAGLERDAVIELLNSRRSQDDEKTKEHRWRIHKPRGVHLLDLAWEWKMRTPQHKPGQNAKLKPTLAGEMLRSVGHAALGTPVNSERLFAALEEAKEHPVRLLLPAVHFKNPKYITPEDREWVILDEEWLERFEELRATVIQKLKANGILIESCPTSNQRIGNLKEPPLKELLTKLPEQTLIATDDPGLFDAWPQHELAKFSTEDRARLLENNRKHSFLRFEG